MTSLLEYAFSIRSLVSLTLVVSLFFNVAAQNNIPIGTWRAHLSFNRITSIASSDESTFAASDVGVLVFDKSERSITSLSKLNGLSSTGITNLAYSEQSQQLIIAYEGGNLDIVSENEVFNFSRLRNPNVTGSKRINHINTNQNLAYLSTDYGVVVFDLLKREVKETWRDLGANGERLSIFQSAFKLDTIFLATEKGVLAGNIRDNLLDFSKWKRFNAGDFNGRVQHVQVFNERIYVGISGKGLYRNSGSGFTRLPLLQNENFISLQSSEDDLLMVIKGNVWMLNKDEQLVQVADNAFSEPLFLTQDQSGVFWIGDANNGLVSNIDGTFESYLPNGPTIPYATRLSFANNKLYAVNGHYNTNGTPLNNPGSVNLFEDGLWSEVNLSANDITDVVASGNKTLYSSFGAGVLVETETEGILRFDHTNSPLETSGSGVLITDLTQSASGTWVANYNANRSLHLFTSDGQWQSFSIPEARFPEQLVTDLSENLWIAISPAHGGGVVFFNPVNGQSRLLTDLAGQGALPHRNVNAITQDRNGNIWVGTDAGVAYFFSPTQDAVKPIFENRFLLRDEIITDIEVDGGNRKWIGTRQGVWLFNATGEELVERFTAENSPLLSNNIIDIETNPENGEVFFSTDKGIISFRGDATESSTASNVIKIFPNPVTSSFTGEVGISGLATDAIVKITDPSGKLIREIKANGGTATWDVRDYRGRRPGTGLYIVFTSAADGSESRIGKIAVID